MALQYCQLCGVLVPNAPAGVDATICERCFATRKLIPPSGDGEGSSHPSAATTQEPERVQFSCPSCQSLLQLPPVKKRTKIKCPRCNTDFYMHPDGRIEGGGAVTPSGPQAKLLEDLRPISDLNALLERVPEKKAAALPSVLDSDAYASFAEGSSLDDARRGATPPAGSLETPSRSKTGNLAPRAKPTPPPAPAKPYEVLPESSESEGVAFAPRVIEHETPPPAKAEEPAPKRTGRITTARRTRDAMAAARREREERELRAADAQRHTLALLERRRKRAFAVARLVALVALPLVLSAVFLASTTAGAGFALKGGLGAKLNDAGELVRRGVQGMEAIVSGK